jgi:hypothetical protein
MPAVVYQFFRDPEATDPNEVIPWIIDECVVTAASAPPGRAGTRRKTMRECADGTQLKNDVN